MTPNILKRRVTNRLKDLDLPEEVKEIKIDAGKEDDELVLYASIYFVEDFVPEIQEQEYFTWLINEVRDLIDEDYYTYVLFPGASPSELN